MIDIERERENYETHRKTAGFTDKALQRTEGEYVNDHVRTVWAGWLLCAGLKQAEIDDLKVQLEQAQADTKRIDFLADKSQRVANVMLPTKIVERNVSSLRDAIDEAINVAKQTALSEMI